MESPRTTYSLGPIELTIRRNEGGRRVGLPGSIVVHVVVVALAVLISSHVKKTPVEREPVKQPSPPIPITFVSPIPAAPAPKPPMELRRPPPATAAKPLRMQSVPEITSAPPQKPTERAKQNSGQRDAKPAGGQAGGPLPDPTAGAPQDERADAPTSPFDEPKSLQGRLQDFRRALEAPPPSGSQGKKGGGTGRGGVVMPALPETGYGVGNLEFEGRDYDWDDYGRQIHAIIWRAWHNRLLTTSSVFERWAAEHRTWQLDHRSGVRFTILRSGKIVDVAIETASGCYPLDDSAADALREVVLPPLPEDFTRESETVHARFLAEGRINEMKSYLTMLKQAGWF